jgi:hypothetical protein
MLATGYDAGALFYHTDTRVQKDAFKCDAGFTLDVKRRPSKKCLVQLENLHGLQERKWCCGMVGRERGVQRARDAARQRA